MSGHIDTGPANTGPVDTGPVDVVIAGGGLIGAGIAWRAVQRGLTVRVVDPDPGSGASQAAGGMLAPVSEATYGEDRLLRLGQESLRRYPEFVAELQAATGHDVGLRTTGTLLVGFDADDMRALDDLHRYHRELGLPAQRLTPGESRRLEPGLTPRLRGALHAAADYSVDARALHAALLAALPTGTLVRARVTAVTVQNGRAIGVTLADGSVLRGQTVVVALGAASAALPGAPALPVRPVGGQILRARSLDGEPLAERTVRALVRGRHVYLVPIGANGMIIGATSEEKGWHSRVTVGGVFELLRDATEVLPALAEAELTETLVRFRPGTPDNAPILGPTPVPGLVVATGHYRNGVLLTPVTADAIAELLVTGALPEVAADFTIARFTAPESNTARFTAPEDQDSAAGAGRSASHMPAG
jgi:glycine oxidase